MHEFGLGEEVVKTVIEEMQRISPPPRSLLSAHIVVGALRRIAPDHMRFVYEVLTSNTSAAGSLLEVTVLPAMALCRDCGWKGNIDELIFLCRNCGSADLQTLQGMELFLDRLEVEQGGTNNQECN
jgi:hydrogenase nickel incorporation protein HypA/HybF